MTFSEGYLKVISKRRGGGGVSRQTLIVKKKFPRGIRKTEKNWAISEGGILWVLMVFFALGIRVNLSHPKGGGGGLRLLNEMA